MVVPTVVRLPVVPVGEGHSLCTRVTPHPLTLGVKVIGAWPVANCILVCNVQPRVTYVRTTELYYMQNKYI